MGLSPWDYPLGRVPMGWDAERKGAYTPWHGQGQAGIDRFVSPGQKPGLARIPGCWARCWAHGLPRGRICFGSGIFYGGSGGLRLTGWRSRVKENVEYRNPAPAWQSQAAVASQSSGGMTTRARPYGVRPPTGPGAVAFPVLPVLQDSVLVGRYDRSNNPGNSWNGG